MQPFLMVENSFQETVRWAVERLSAAGLEVIETFNLKTAVPALNACGCLHHGTDLCDCQMVVLLVYENGHPPTSVVLHGRDGQTRFSIVDSPQQRPDIRTETLIHNTLKQTAETADAPDIDPFIVRDERLPIQAQANSP